MADKRNNNDDIENLSLDDAEVELKVENIKLEPQDVTIENLDFNVDGSGDLSSSTDNALSTGDSEKNTEPLESGKLSDNSSDVATGNSSDADASSGLNSPSSENVPANESNSENAPSEVEPSDSSDVSNNADSSEKDSGKTDGDVDNKEDKKTDSDEKKETDDKKPEQKKDDLENKNDDKKNDNKNSNDREDSPEKKDSGDKNKAPEEKKEQKNDGKKSDEKPSSASKNDKKTSSNKPGQNKNSLKDRWNNRPKNPKEFANRAKDGIKNGAKNRFNNSKAGRAIDKGKKAVEKGKKAVEGAKKAVTAAKTLVSFLSTPAGWITLAVIAGLLLILVIVIMVPSLFASGSPGVGGEVENEENYSKYSEVDQETIDKLKEITEKYPTGDPTYAMAATLYPYIEEMQNGNVGSLRGKTNVEQEDDEDVYDETEQAENSDESDGDLEDNQNDNTDDDPYLELFRERKYRNKFKKLLKESRSGEEALTTYLKDTWFSKDAGYKELFDGVDNTEELADAIIDDLLNQKDDFEGYFFDNTVCSVNMSSIGTVEIDEMLKSNILVDVKVESCYTSDVDSCESMYSTPISMEKYIMGVTYEEIGVSSTSDIEKVKAQMVAAKSYAIGRSSSMGWDVKQTDDGSYVIQIRANTNDQDYCDIDTGCQDKINGAKRGPIDDATRALMSEAWEATKNDYIYDTDKKSTVGAFCQSRTGVCDFCSKGTCLAHEELSDYRNTAYDKILGDQYSSYAFISVQGDYADASIASGETCSISGLGIPDDQFKFYYQTDYPHVAFCGATDHTDSCESGSNSICSSGCGVTSLAMLIANLSDDTSFDPIAANEEAQNNGGCAVGSGTYDSLFTNIANSHDGFRYEKLANTKEGANNAVAAIRDGALIVANVQANSPFTNGGHWIVLRGTTEDGMVKVADPYSEERSTTGTYNIEDFIDKNWLDGHSWFAIYGPKSEEIKAMNDAASETGAVGEVIDTTNGLKGQFFAPIQNGNLKMYGRNSTNDYKYHDLGASCGTAVYSPADGTATFKTITRNGKLASYGNEVEITTTDGYRFVLSHLKSFVGYNVKFGTESTYPSSCGSGGCSTYTYGSRTVKQGEKIGLSGTSGNSTGCHLHIEIWKGGTRLEPSGLLGYDVQ